MIVKLAWSRNLLSVALRHSRSVTKLRIHWSQGVDGILISYLIVSDPGDGGQPRLYSVPGGRALHLFSSPVGQARQHAFCKQEALRSGNHHHHHHHHITLRVKGAGFCMAAQKKGNT